MLLFTCAMQNAWSQCGGIMEPGFAFLSSSRGCAPYSVQIKTTYLSSVAGTNYFVNWGDGSPEEVYTQVDNIGVVISHAYPNSPVDCGYDLTIDAANACNPRGSVVPIETQVIVWTNDVISIDPGLYRVCQGFAADVLFTDNSDWNCYPRATRQNGEPRWIQWIYGTGPLPNFIPGIQVNGITPGAFPFLDPAPGRNPIYPVLSPGQISLPVHVPITTPADIGKEFVITLKNWNQCNPYDNDILDGNPFNPVNNNLVNGDNTPQVTTGRIVIVDAPKPEFVTRLGNATGAIQTIFCIGDNIYFDNNTPNIVGAQFYNTWEFYDNGTGAGAPVVRNSTNPTFSYGSPGQKLIRLRVKDNNAVGNCEAYYEATVTISPSVLAQIRVTDLSGNVIVPDFCQETSEPFIDFQALFTDVSVGTITATTQWRWEFYNENNVVVRQEPAGGGFSSTPIGPLNQAFANLGVYRVRLVIRDNVTSCESIDEVQVRVFEKPQPNFSFNNVCEGTPTTFTDLSTLNAINGQQIILREWDMNYVGTTFNKDPSLDNQLNFNHLLGPFGNYRVALRVTTDLAGCSAIYDQTVVVDAAPVAAFTPNVTSGCSVLNVNFTNNSVTTQPGGIVVKEYIWEVDGGAGFVTDSIQSPTNPQFEPVYTKEFKNTGSTNITFGVRLRVITMNSCERVSAPVTITVFPGPKSGFMSVNYSPFNDNCTPEAVDFTVDAQTQFLNPSEYQWNISDANGVIDQISTGVTPAFTYNFINNTQSIKNFIVTLRAILPSGCYGDSARAIRINPVPVSAFTINPIASDCERMNFQVSATQKGLAQYRWIISINGVTVLSSITLGDQFDYEFPRILSGPQNISVELTTVNFANCESVATTKDFITPQKGNIGASFTASPASQTLPNATVTLVNNTNPGNWAYLWDFGDGTTSTDSNVGNHVYAKFGTYVIKLAVSDGTCTETAVNTIQIKPIPPILDFEYFPPSGCAPLKVTFNNLSQYADPSTYFWEFGINQGTSHAINPTYVYYEPGVYSVTLTAANELGETSHVTKQMIIDVYEKPNADFALKPQLVYLPGGKLFTKNESFGAGNYLWDFGDGSTSTDFEPIHTYTDIGTFDVTLIAYSARDCADTVTLKTGVRVLNGGEMLVPNAFSPSTSGPHGSGQNDIFIPLMRGVSSFEMMVFNRWGQLLFETKNPEVGWDGYFNGKLCQQDVYVYKIKAKYASGETVTKVGDIHLIQ